VVERASGHELRGCNGMKLRASVPVRRHNGAVTIGEDLRSERHQRRLAGDPRITPEGRALLLRLTTGDLMDEFQAALDADLAADPALGGHDADVT